MSKTNTLQAWAEKNGVKGIRFFPSNPSQSSPSEIKDSAMKAIRALEAGRVIAYQDKISDH